MEKNGAFLAQLVIGTRFVRGNMIVLICIEAYTNSDKQWNRLLYFEFTIMTFT